MIEQIQITAGARLHFTLLDMHGAFSGRVDGGLGVPIEYPRVKLTMRKSSTSKVTSITSLSSNIETEFEQQILAVLSNIQGEFRLGGVHVAFNECIPPHAGFGSKTQTLLSVAYGYCEMFDIKTTPESLAALIKRGGTSGIGVESFFNGGLIVDCGHKFENKGNLFTPSSLSSHITRPPLVGRYTFPNWPVLIVTPHQSRQIYGDVERALFEAVCPIPLGDVQQCAHVILMMTIPAVIESNLKVFCESINIFQKLRWKQFEINAQTPIVRETMKHLSDIGLDGIGMSSWGGSVFAFGEKLSYASDEIIRKTNMFLAENGGGVCFVTNVKNNGARIEKK